MAEAGHAGDVCLGPGFCVGLTGQVVAVDLHHDRQTVLAAGLPSAGGPVAASGWRARRAARKLFAIVGLNPQSFGNPADYCPDSACLATVTAVQNGSGFLNKLRSLRSNRGFEGFAASGVLISTMPPSIQTPEIPNTPLATQTHSGSQQAPTGGST